MDNQNRKELSKYRFQKALETLDVAKYCFQNGYYRDSINRSYYAAFYATKAVLALDFIDFKKHKDVLAHFNKTYVATEVFPKDMGRKLSMMMQMRDKSDYDDFFIAEKSKAEEQLCDAEYIISSIYNYLEKNKNIS